MAAGEECDGGEAARDPDGDGKRRGTRSGRWERGGKAGKRGRGVAISGETSSVPSNRWASLAAPGLLRLGYHCTYKAGGDTCLNGGAGGVREERPHTPLPSL